HVKSYAIQMHKLLSLQGILEILLAAILSGSLKNLLPTLSATQQLSDVVADME
ncbi:hypothetical protein FRC11_002200, partial [Ceratobasidium sp. 423]